MPQYCGQTPHSTKRSYIHKLSSSCPQALQYLPMICSTSNHTFVTLANGKLKRGSLDMLPSLPLDVLCEVPRFSLHPSTQYSDTIHFRYFVSCIRRLSLSSLALPNHFVAFFSKGLPRLSGSPPGKMWLVFRSYRQT